MTYLLMNKDIVVASFVKHDNGLRDSYKLIEVFGKLPYGVTSINGWLASRQASKHRKHIERLLKEHGCDTLEGFIRVLHCTGINDTFWVKREDESVTWKDVSLYSNEFDESITRIAFEGAGLIDGAFSSTSPEFAIDGNYEKCCIRENGKLYLIKRGAHNLPDEGREPYSECFSYPIYKHIAGDVVQYELVKFRGIVSSKCELFTNEEVGYVPIVRLVNYTDNLNVLYEYYDSIGSLDKFRAMIVADAVCFNEDRHGGNHGVLVNNSTLDILTMAPLFDHNLTLLSRILPRDYTMLDRYISFLKVRIGNSWIESAREVLTPSLRRKLVELRGYEIPWNGDSMYTKEMAQLVSKQINRQIDKILQ